MTQNRHQIIELPDQIQCPSCNSSAIQLASQVWAEGTTYGNHNSYALSVGRIRSCSVYQSEVAARVHPPQKPEIARLPFILWLIYWMSGWIWDLFYCLTGGMNQPKYISLVITKFMILVVVSLLIFGLQKLAVIPGERRYERDLKRWRNTFVCGNCGNSFTKVN